MPLSARRLAAAAVGTAAAMFCFHDSVVAYLGDHYYQSHFLFLWVFFAAAIWRTGRGAALTSRLRAGRRGVAGLGLVALALLALHLGLMTGSSTVQRCALVLAFTGTTLLAAVGWSIGRCLSYGLFALLCFGIPYSAYFELTRVFRETFVALLALLAQRLPLGFGVDGLGLQFADYRLAITPDCSGFNQLVTFLGIAFLGVLTGRPSLRRGLGLFALGVGLAYASNLVRILLFAGLVGLGQRQVVEQEGLHALVGFAVYAPFLLGFIWVVLRTHREPAAVTRPAAPSGALRGVPLVVLVLPFVALRAGHLVEPAIDDAPPAFFTALAALPAGYDLDVRAASEEHERAVYDTPWLINAALARDDGERFELFAYLTRSRRHLAVHHIANCLEVPGSRVHYGPPVAVAGRTFWTLEVRGDDGRRQHGYFAFWIDGQDAGDGIATQLEVFARRLGGLREVGLTRLLRPGPLVLPPPAADLEILAWRARQLRQASGDPVAAPAAPATLR